MAAAASPRMSKRCTNRPKRSYDFKILEAVSSVNEQQKLTLVRKLKRYYDWRIERQEVCPVGLAFKPDTDDIREAPSLEIIAELTAAGASVVAFDPEAQANVERLLADNKQLSFADSAYDALKDADALLIATEWSEFQNP